jgi:hypothetical protein
MNFCVPAGLLDVDPVFCSVFEKIFIHCFLRASEGNHLVFIWKEIGSILVMSKWLPTVSGKIGFI